LSTILTVKNLKKQFGGLSAVNNVSFEVYAGDIFGIIGPNGAGKTTIFNMIAGAFAPTSGSINFLGTEIIGMYTYNIAQLGIARTFQNTRVFHNMTTAENIFIGGIQRYSSGIYNGLLGLRKSRKEKMKLEMRVREELDFLGITRFANISADNLSYGHQRLLEIARSLVSLPKLLLLDEPGAGMNPTETAELMEVIDRIRNRGITTIVIEHDMKVIRGICNRALVVNTGEPIVEGTPEEVLSHPEVIEAYLGRVQSNE
jgi:branched-chain amino acid transport system ATP-binding protein